MSESCNTCTFFKGKQGPGKEGRCKRFPHAIDKSPHDWCGEFIRDPRLIRRHKPSVITVGQDE